MLTSLHHYFFHIPTSFVYRCFRFQLSDSDVGRRALTVRQSPFLLTVSTPLSKAQAGAASCGPLKPQLPGISPRSLLPFFFFLPFFLSKSPHLGLSAGAYLSAA